LKNAHLGRSLQGISGAPANGISQGLHLGIFDQPEKMSFSTGSKILQKPLFAKGVVDGQRPLKFPSQRILIRVFNFNRKFSSGSIFVLKAFQRNKIRSSKLTV
jgi:hypothetical protein